MAENAPDDLVAQGARFALDECNAYLELGLTDSVGRIRVMRELKSLLHAVTQGAGNPALVASIETIVATIAGIDQAATEQVQRAQQTTAVLAKRLKAGTVRTPQAAISLTQIETELRRREAFATQMHAGQEQLEDERASVLEEFETTEALMRVDGKQHKARWTELKDELALLDGNVETLVLSIAENARDVNALKEYERALKLVHAGLDIKLIDRDFTAPLVTEKRKKPQG